MTERPVPHRPSHHDMPRPANTVHRECRGPACPACAAEQELDERNQR
jgi:hypothetical protein